MSNIVYRPKLPVGYDPALWKDIRAQWVARNQSMASTLDYKEWHTDRMKDFLKEPEEPVPIAWLFHEEVGGPEADSDAGHDGDAGPEPTQ